MIMDIISKEVIFSNDEIKNIVCEKNNQVSDSELV